MKNLFTSLFSFLFIGLYAQSSNLTVEINNISSQKGKVLMGLYNSEKGYPNENEFKNSVIKPNAETITYTFKNVPYGEYAIAVLHDENDNGKMDIGMLGPKEDYGFSNNARGIVSAPPFKKAAFKHTGKQKIKITVK